MKTEMNIALLLVLVNAWIFDPHFFSHTDTSLMYEVHAWEKEWTAIQAFRARFVNAQR